MQMSKSPIISGYDPKIWQMTIINMFQSHDQNIVVLVEGMLHSILHFVYHVIFFLIFTSAK